MTGLPRETSIAASMRGAELTTLYVGPDHCVTLYKNLLLLIANDDPLPSTSQVLPGFVKRLQRESPGKVGFMVVLRPENPPPKEAARVTIKEAFQTFSTCMSVGAFVVERVGFAAAAQRSVLNMVMLAARPPFAMKVFGTVDEASQWVAGKFSPEVSISGPELNGVIRDLTAAYSAGTLVVKR